MNRSHRPSPRSRLPSYLMIAAPLLAVLGSVLGIALWPTQPEAHARAVAQQRATAVRSAPVYISSDPSLPRPGTFTLPAEASAQVETF